MELLMRMPNEALVGLVSLSALFALALVAYFSQKGKNETNQYELIILTVLDNRMWTTMEQLLKELKSLNIELTKERLIFKLDDLRNKGFIGYDLRFGKVRYFLTIAGRRHLRGDSKETERLEEAAAG